MKTISRQKIVANACAIPLCITFISSLFLLFLAMIDFYEILDLIKETWHLVASFNLISIGTFLLAWKYRRKGTTRFGVKMTLMTIICYLCLYFLCRGNTDHVYLNLFLGIAVFINVFSIPSFQSGFEKYDKLFKSRERNKRNISIGITGLATLTMFTGLHACMNSVLIGLITATAVLAFMYEEYYTHRCYKGLHKITIWSDPMYYLHLALLFCCFYFSPYLDFMHRQ